METLIDGDLASNNGGWQWSASTGVDPAPYFRIFNPYTQSHKVGGGLGGRRPSRYPCTRILVRRLTHARTQVDPTGEYIRTFVPELAKVRGEGELPPG